MKRLLLLITILLLSLAGCVGPTITSAPPTIRSLAAVNAPGQYGVEFYADISGGQPPVSYQWVVGDSSGVLYGSNPTYQYNTNGDYEATVTATDSLGRSASESIELKVYPNEVICFWDTRGGGDTFPGGCWTCTFEDWGMVLPSAEEPS